MLRQAAFGVYLHMRKHLRELVDVARRQGWRVERNNHIKFYAPDGHTIVVAACTESDVRAIHNTKARLRRAGLHV